MTRKSPTKHTVHKHSRDGRTVRSYVRGSGRKPKPPTPTTRYRVPEQFTAIIDGRTHIINAPSFERAILAALSVSPKLPKELTITHE